MANILKELFRNEKNSSGKEKNVKYEIGVEAKNVVLNNEDSREAYTNLADKLKIFNKMNNIRLTKVDDLKQIGNASGALAHAEGESTLAEGKASHAEGGACQAIGDYSHAEGCNSGNTHTIARGEGAHAEGRGTLASESGAHAEGELTTASGWYAHAEGYSTTASHNAAHAEGTRTIAQKEATHAEGQSTLADATGSHAEGIKSQTGPSATGAHAEGYDTRAIGYASHAEGCETRAEGNYSHTEGSGTVSQWANQHVQGRYNEIFESDNEAKKYAHIVGGGTYNSGNPIRKNIHTLDWDGNAYFAGTITAKSITNETGEGGFKTDRLEVGNETILGKGHEVTSKDGWVKDSRDLTDSVSIEKVDYLTFGQLNILNSPGTSQWSSSQALTAYYGTFPANLSQDLSNGFYEIDLLWYKGSGVWHGPLLLQKTSDTNFILYGIKDQSIEITVPMSKIAYISLKYTLKRSTIFTNSGVLIQGQYSDLSLENSNSIIHIVGGGTSENDRKNIYTLDEKGNVYFSGNIVNGVGHLFKTSSDWIDLNSAIEVSGVLQQDNWFLENIGFPYPFYLKLPQKIDSTTYYKYCIDLSYGPFINQITSNFDWKDENGNLIYYLGYGSGYRGQEANLIAVRDGAHLLLFSNSPFDDNVNNSQITLTFTKKGVNIPSNNSNKTESGILFSGQYGIYDSNKEYIQVVGNGESAENRSNAYTLDKDGNAYFSGDISFTYNNQIVTLSSLLAKLNTLENQLKS